uniref:CRAL-TRIO domain-containing protein n=1 Tax=Setaria digitata TaxID=48799 RepID=A0A915Q0A8_9BILA
MTRSISTNFGESLSTESKKLVDEVRLKITQPMHPNFDKDFNIYRFVLASERILKKKKDIVETASKTLNNHLRIRKAFNIDNLPDLPFPENPIYSQRILPMGTISEALDSCNKFLWYGEYRTLNIEVNISPFIKLLQEKHHAINDLPLSKELFLEEKTGRLSGIRHIIDLNGYEINKFTMIYATNGSLTYFSQLFHFENYPELIGPVEIINTSKWIHVPYKIARTMLPGGFTERFRLYDENFLPNLLKDVKIEDIPVALGGKNEQARFQAAEPEYFKRKVLDPPTNMETIVILPRKRHQIYVDIKEKGKRLQWYFTTDADIYFGIFYESSHQILSSKKAISDEQEEQEIDTDALEMVYPYFKLTTRFIPEVDSMECTRPGRYWIIICNRLSWIRRKTMNLIIQLVDNESGVAMRCYSDGTLENCSKPFVTNCL